MYLQHYKYLWSEVKVVHITVAESVYTNLYDWAYRLEVGVSSVVVMTPMHAMEKI